MTRAQAIENAVVQTIRENLPLIESRVQIIDIRIHMYPERGLPRRIEMRPSLSREIGDTAMAVPRRVHMSGNIAQRETF